MLRDFLAGALAMFVIGRACAIVSEWLRNRPRKATTARSYFDPCGPPCGVRACSQIGWRARTDDYVARLAVRLSRRLRRRR